MAPVWLGFPAAAAPVDADVYERGDAHSHPATREDRRSGTRGDEVSVAGASWAALPDVNSTPGTVPGAGAEAGTVPGAGARADWRHPLPGATVIRGFEPPPEEWLAGHRGVDLEARPGTEVFAPAAGTVHFSGMVAGRPVLTLRVGSHLSSFEPVESTLRAGERVEAGAVLGTLAAEPRHCPDSSCVHWGVRQNGAYVDPMGLLAVSRSPILLPQAERPEPLPERPSGSGAGPWGGHENGRIPAVALCPITHAPHHLLRCDAARGFEALNRSFQAAFGRPIAVTDAYRDYASQVRLKREKGRMAATPGTSNHGWGLAVDLGGGINRFGTREHEWMRAHAPAHGWVHPPWAQAGGSLPEPWHWEWAG